MQGANTDFVANPYIRQASRTLITRKLSEIPISYQKAQMLKELRSLLKAFYIQDTEGVEKREISESKTT